MTLLVAHHLPMPQFSGALEYCRMTTNTEALARLRAWEDDMVKRYNAYCELHGLIACSADELEFAIQCMETTPTEFSDMCIDPDKQAQHLAFLSEFIAEWMRWEEESAVYWQNGSYAGTSAEDYE